ncbi:hypothetical protein AB0L82_27180 [Nocardia sp. NPDC052001]|uniref:hypothetical protein n=1 Tax=Nocardia sp. NPDC052001 TaxID=3154853 RepID=UPI00342E73B9
MAVEVVAVVPSDSADDDLLRFRDASSGCTFWVGTPQAHPGLWRRNITGALRAYRRYGVDPALEYDKTVNGHSSALFVAAIDPFGDVVAGMRVQGPYSHVDEVNALRAWAGRPGESALRKRVADRIPEGVVEVKAVWADRGLDRSQRRALGAALDRCVVHVTTLLGARYGFVTAGEHAAEGYRSSGARSDWWIPAVPFPDDRYRTVPLWWDMRSYRSVAAESQLTLIDAEQIALADGDGAEPADLTGTGGRARQ